MVVRYKNLYFLGFPGYRVGDDGSVWSRMSHRGRGTGLGSTSCIRGTWRRLSLNNLINGRVPITLHSKGYVKTFFVHRLVLMAFVGPCPEGMEACHFPDRDPTNNRLDNLRWGTHLENVSHKIVHGTNVGNRGNCRGELQGSSKLTDSIVLKIRRLFASGRYTQVELASRFGVRQGIISGIVRGVAWTHVGGPLVTVGRGGNRKSRSSKIRGVT